MTSEPTDYVSLTIVTIGNEQDKVDEGLMMEFRRDILQICVEESLHLPGMFTIVVNNPYAPTEEGTKPWKYNERIIQVGKTVKIGFISSTNSSENKNINNPYPYIIEGEITSIEAHFTGQTQAPIVIRGYDISHRLHRGRYIRSFQDYADADIVKKIAEEVGIKTDKIDSIGKKHEYVFQENQTNMEFLRERAARIGFELFVQDGKLNFRKPKINDTLKLIWLQDFTSFRVRLTSAEQVKAVEVRSWDYERKEPIVARIPKQNQPIVSNILNTANPTGQTISQGNNQTITNTEYGKGSEYSQKFGANSPEPKAIFVDKAIATLEEAEIMAEALFSELEGDFICADARGQGNPRIRPGKIVELANMGRYSGKYYITESRHLFYEGVYTTEFSVRGLRGGDLLQTLSPTTRLRPGQTHLVGIVTDNKDPKGWGRVRVKFPTLTPEKDSTAHASYWARVVGVGAGSGRGFDCLPEINDEVLVAFEHGDIHRPYVIGGVWNGKDQPPTSVKDSVTTKGEVRLRTFQTRTKHTLQFVEEDQGGSAAGVYIQTSQGHQIRLNDSNESIEIKTKDQQLLRLDNTGITVKSSKGHINLVPGSGQVVVSGTLVSDTVLTGGVFLGTQVSSAVNVGTTLTGLQRQVTENEKGDRQRDQTLNNLKEQVQSKQSQQQPPTDSQNPSPSANSTSTPPSN